MPTAPVDGFGLFLSPVWIDANFPHRLLHISTFPGGDPQALGSVFPGKISPGLGVGSVVALVDVRADVLDDLVGLRVGLALLFDPLDGVQDGGVVPVVELLADVFQGELRHVPGEIDGDVPGPAGGLGPPLPPDGIGVDVVELADLLDDDLGGGQDV